MDDYKFVENEIQKLNEDKTFPSEFTNIEDTIKYENFNQLIQSISLECLLNTDERVVLLELRKVLNFLDQENSFLEINVFIIERVIEILRSGKCSYNLSKSCIDIIEYICIQNDAYIHDHLHLGFLDALLDVISLNRYVPVVASALNSYHCAIYNKPLTSSSIDGNGFVSATLFVLSCVQESPEIYITFVPKDENEEEEINEAENEEARLSELVMKALILASDALSFFSVDKYQIETLISYIFTFLNSDLIGSNTAALRAISTIAYYNTDLSLDFFTDSNFLSRCAELTISCPLGIKYFAISCINNLCSLNNNICHFFVASPIIKDITISEDWSLRALRAFAKFLSTILIGIADNMESIRCVEINKDSLLECLFAIIANCDAKTREFGDDALFSLICLKNDSINITILENEVNLPNELISCALLQNPDLVETALKASIVLSELCERNSSEAFAHHFLDEILSEDYESALDSAQSMFPAPSAIFELCESIKQHLDFQQ